MVLANEELHHVREQLFIFDSLALGDRPRPDDEIKIAGDQLRQERRQRLRDDHDAPAGAGTCEAIISTAQYAVRNAGRYADVDVAADPEAQIAHFAQRLFEPSAERLNTLMKGATYRRERYAVRRAIEELHLQLGLQPAHALGEGGLRDVQ